MFEHALNRPSRRSRRSSLRRAAAAVEFALISPLLILITMGMVEIGRVVMVQQVLVNVSREGARLAIKPDMTSADIQAFANQELTNQGIAGASVTTTPSELNGVAAGTAVTVTVTVPAANVSWIPNPMFTLGNTLLAETTMRREDY